MVDTCAWKSDKDLVPEDQIESLLSSLLEAEKRRWLASISPLNSGEHDQNLEPDEEGERRFISGESGSDLLRHGRCVDEIHSRFHQYDPSRYCLKATTNKPNSSRPSSQIKVVSSEESSDIRGTSVSPSTVGSFSERSSNPSVRLTERDPSFELYKNALLCAKYPRLSEIQQLSPSTPYSPVLSPSVQRRKFSFSKLPHSASSVTSDAKAKGTSGFVQASSDGPVSPDVFSPTLSDALDLQELVRNVFSLQKREQEYFSETAIPRLVPLAKDPQLLLVRELENQKLVLKRNHHPYYSVQAFMNKDAYGEWVRLEEEKINCLIKSFWHNSSPSVTELPLRSEYHKQYVDLLERLIGFESTNKEIHPVHGGITPTAPLSTTACKLLKEFELRYGIGLLFCKISYLEYLAKYLENERWYITHVTVCLQDVMDLVFKCPEFYVEKEFKMLLSILSNLLGKTKYALTNIRKIFPGNSPKDGVPKLVALFMLALESATQLQSQFRDVFSTRQMAVDFARNLPTEPFEDLLASYIKTEIEGRYDRLKVIATDDLGETCCQSQLLLNVILEIRQEVNDYEDYKMAFRSVFDIKGLAAVKFYSLLMSDVAHLCENSRRTAGNDVVDPNMLSLAFRLSNLDDMWAKFIDFSHQIWREHFQEFALHWLDAIGRLFQTLVHQLIGSDVWKAADVHITRTQRRTFRRKQARLVPRGPIGAQAASLPSLTPSRHSAFDTVVPSTSAPSMTKVSHGTANHVKGKEPSRSTESLLGYRRPLRNQGFTGTDGRCDSSSDDEFPHALHSKANPIVVTAQVHNSAADADSTAKVKTLQSPNHQEKRVTHGASVEYGGDPRDEESSAFVPMDRNPESTNSRTSSSKKGIGKGSTRGQSVDVGDPSFAEHLDRKQNEECKPQRTAPPSQAENAKQRSAMQAEVNTSKVGVSGGSSLEESQDSTENKADTSVSIKRPENGFNHLPVSGIHSEEQQGETLLDVDSSENHTSSKLDHPVERAESQTKSVCSSDVPEEADIFSFEEGLGCSAFDSGSETSFENDSTDESDVETVIVKDDSKEYDCVDVPSAKSNSMSAELHNDVQGDSNKRNRKLYLDHGDSDKSEHLPRKNKYGDTERDNGCVEGVQGSTDSEQSITSPGLKGFHPPSYSAPVSIPAIGAGAARHKSVSRLLNTGGSVGSTLSDCSNYVTAAGSVRSGNSIDTFYSTLSRIASSSKDDNSVDNSAKQSFGDPAQCSGIDADDGHSSKTQSVDEESTKVLPVSSSFVDVICAVNRLTTFACHLCKILCPHENLQRDEEPSTVSDELRNGSLHVKRALCSRLIKVMLSFVTLYSDNVLSLDTCGLPDQLFAEILDEQVQRDLTLLRDAGRLQGCRYNPVGTRCCNRRNARGRHIPPCEELSRVEANIAQFEPLTQQMGVRISNVMVLRSVLPWLSQYVSSCVDNPDSLLSTHDRYALVDPDSEMSNSLSYCEHGPSLDGVPNSSAGEAATRDNPPLRTNALHDPTMLTDDTEHLCRLETAQINLATYRMNKFLEQVLRQLLHLNLPRYTIKKRLRPAMGFLSRVLRRFHGVMYPDCFNKLLTDFWSKVVENFKGEANHLVRQKSSALEHSKLLQQAVTYLMQYFHAEGVGLSYDKLLTPIEAVVKHIQLYTHPTTELISMFHSLFRQVPNLQQQFRGDELESSASVSSHRASANAPADFVVQALRRELHTTRKCFSGAQLVEWMENYVRNNGFDNLGVCIGDTETETGLELGQYLLEHGIILCVSPPPRFNRQTPVERRRTRDGAVPNAYPPERGQVIISDEGPPDIRINNITVPSVRSRTSSESTSRSASRSTTVNDSDSQGEADDEDDDIDDNFLGSASDIWGRFNSALSEREATFYNHPLALYKFVSEEDSHRTEIKIRLGINNRLHLPDKLKQIVCVLFTRKDFDRGARDFIRGLPIEVLQEALGVEEVRCLPVLRICQAL